MDEEHKKSLTRFMIAIGAMKMAPLTPGQRTAALTEGDRMEQDWRFLGYPKGFFQLQCADRLLRVSTGQTIALDIDHDGEIVGWELVPTANISTPGIGPVSVKDFL